MGTRFLVDEYLHSKNLLAQKDLIVGISELVVQAEQMIMSRDGVGGHEKVIKDC